MLSVGLANTNVSRYNHFVIDPDEIHVLDTIVLVKRRRLNIFRFLSISLDWGAGGGTFRLNFFQFLSISIQFLSIPFDLDSNSLNISRWGEIDKD